MKLQARTATALVRIVSQPSTNGGARPRGESRSQTLMTAGEVGCTSALRRSGSAELVRDVRREPWLDPVVAVATERAVCGIRELHVYPNVNACASAPGSRNVIASVLSGTASCWRTTW